MLKSKMKKLVALCCAIALMATCSISAFATTYYVDMSFTQSVDNAWYQDFYEIGSVAPYDDVSAATHVYAGSGSGYAYAYVRATNGSTASTSSSTKLSSGWVESPWAVVAGQDYGDRATFSGTGQAGSFSDVMIDD